MGKLNRDAKRKAYDRVFLGDTYVKSVIKIVHEIGPSDMPEELIDFKRESLQFHRLLREVKRKLK